MMATRVALAPQRRLRTFRELRPRPNCPINEYQSLCFNTVTSHHRDAGVILDFQDHNISNGSSFPLMIGLIL